MLGGSCSYQIFSLTALIENGFEKRLKTSAAFIDLTAGYDTVWREEFLAKLYQLIHTYFIRLMDEMVRGGLFTLTANEARCGVSRMAYLRVQY